MTLATDPLSLTFTALAHPARRAILARLSLGEATVGDLAAPLNISAPAMTKHLKSLERGGLIRRSRNAQWRPCRLDVEPMRGITGWIEEIRSMTEQRLDRLEAYLQTLQCDAPESAEAALNPQGDRP